MSWLCPWPPTSASAGSCAWTPARGRPAHGPLGTSLLQADPCPDQETCCSHRHALSAGPGCFCVRCAAGALGCREGGDPEHMLCLTRGAPTASAWASGSAVIPGASVALLAAATSRFPANGAPETATGPGCVIPALPEPWDRPGAAPALGTPPVASVFLLRNFAL